MGPAQPQLVLLAAMALLSAGLLPQALGKGKGRGAVHPQVAGICVHTPFPEVCKSTAGRHASKYPVIDNLAVLNMQMDAFAKGTSKARKHVKARKHDKASRTNPSAQRKALKYCDRLYMNTQDNIGAARRAILYKDTGTAKIMMQLAVQNFDSCNRRFTDAGIPNPMEKFVIKLNQMANNCMALANMI